MAAPVDREPEFPGAALADRYAAGDNGKLERRMDWKIIESNALRAHLQGALEERNSPGARDEWAYGDDELVAIEREHARRISTPSRRTRGSASSDQDARNA
jgi:hypothetical protein